MATRVESRDVTALDFFKGFVVLLMFVDHSGDYFFPEMRWLRAMGRTGFPTFFFLPGYSKNRKIELSWWIGGIALVVGNILSGKALLPLNALFTIMIIRASIDGLIRYMTSDAVRTATLLRTLVLLLPFTWFAFEADLHDRTRAALEGLAGLGWMFIVTYLMRGQWRFWGTALLLAALFPVSYILFEYGTLGLIMGVFGYLCRHRDETPGGDRLALQFGVFAWITFTFGQQYIFHFDIFQFVFMSLGCGLHMYLLYRYKPVTFPRFSRFMGGIPGAIVRFCGRYTLEIYVCHLLLFKGIRLLLHPDYLLKGGLFLSREAKLQTMEEL